MSTSGSRPLRLVRTAFRISWADRLEVARALAVAVAIELGLRTVKLPGLAARLGVPLETEQGEPSSPMVERLPEWAMRRLYFSTRLMDRWPWGGTCLRRSLLVGNRLRRLGPRLRIGVDKGEGRLRVHAWVEIDGRHFDASAVEFETLRRLP